MSLVIYNARVPGYHPLVKIKCDPETCCITSVEPLHRKGIVPSWLRRRGLRSFASVVQLRRTGEKVIIIDAGGSLVLPGLIQAHIHLSQAFLDAATNPYRDSRLSRSGLAFVGSLSDTRSFRDADTINTMRRASVTSQLQNVMARGRQLIETSLAHGVTSMRAQVEVDTHVGHRPLQAGRALQKEFEGRCDIRLAVFASQPIFCEPDQGFDPKHTEHMKRLLHHAAAKDGVRAIGSAPFNEENGMAALLNIQFMLDLAEMCGVDVEFHLDFDITQDGRIYDLIEEIQQRPIFHSDFWSPEPAHAKFPLRVTIAHYGRLASLSMEERCTIAELVADWEIYFVGLSHETKGFLRRAGTSATSAMDGFQHEISEHGWAVPSHLENSQNGSLVKDLDGHTSLAVENLGALTSAWEVDPLALLTLDTLRYKHTLTDAQAQSLLRMVTINAAAAAGMGKRAHPQSLQLRPGDVANLVILDGCFDCKSAVLNPPSNRITIKRGTIVAGAPVKGRRVRLSE